MNCIKQLLKSISLSKTDLAPENNDYALLTASATDLGRMRTNNEDSLLLMEDTTTATLLLAVADGMGGHNGGEVASKIATSTLRESFTISVPSPQIFLKKSFQRANDLILETAKSDEYLNGMGTTLTAVLVQKNHLYLGHIGDSRAYLLRNGKITQITTDHSMVEEMVRQGQLAKADKEQHPMRHVLTQVLGTKPTFNPQFDALQNKFTVGDVLLLCSDGFYEYFTESELVAMFEQSIPLNQIVEEAVSQANERGGKDNISLIVLKKQADVAPNRERITTA